MIKKITKIIFFLLFVFLGIALIKQGIYYEKLSSPKYLYKTGIDIITTNTKDILELDHKYIFGDNFSVTGDIDFNISSDKYKRLVLTDEEYKKKYNLINNLSNMDIKYDIVQDKKNKKLYLALDEKINTETIVNYKYLVDNSTKYYFVVGILNNYVNDGSNNYFEIFTEDETTLTNMDYLYNFISDSLAKELGEESEKYKKTINIGDSSKEVNEVSVKIDNKAIIDILEGILEDIKKDEKANKIMTSIDNDFSKRKVDNKKEYLSNKESYTINVYSSKFLNKPLKYEVLYAKNNEKKAYSYEGNSKKGTFFYIEDDELKYSAEYTGTKKEINIKVFDKLQKDVGNIKIDKDVNNIMLNISLALDNKKYDVVLSTKYKDLEKKKSYNIDRTMSIKIVDKDEIELSGEIKSLSKVTSDPKIDIDLDKSVLKSTLTEEQNSKIDNLYETVKGRLENEK